MPWIAQASLSSGKDPLTPTADDVVVVVAHAHPAGGGHKVAIGKGDH
jgi:hypothetical protein